MSIWRTRSSGAPASGKNNSRRRDFSDLRSAAGPLPATLLVLALFATCATGRPSEEREPVAQDVATASEDTASITLRWSTATEFERYGYDVYRSDSAEGPFQRVTQEPIPGAGTTDLPQHYRFEDSVATPGSIYFYYVESISTAGHRKRLTPVRGFRASGSASSDRP